MTNHIAMHIVTKRTISTFSTKHAEAKTALEEWYTKTKKADWKTFEDIKMTFNSVDSAGNDRYVFNIKGNKYRLVGLIFFHIKIVYIRFIGTHAEYDETDCKNI